MLKCIIWDLDDTLWEGTLQQDDITALKPEALELVERADRLGILQSVVSRNHAQQALDQLERFGVRNYFLYPQIQKPIAKSEAIRTIIKQLNIGENSILFVDDNPFELYEVNQYVPLVQTLAANELEKLQKLLTEMESQEPLHSENRRVWMQMREQRVKAEQAFQGSREAFLQQCNMKLTLKIAENKDLLRVTELVARTNILNNLRKRFTQTEIQAYQGCKDKWLYICNLQDRFGDHGIVGACLLRKENQCLHLDLFCISCRVEGRGIGNVFLRTAIGQVYQDNSELQTVACHYRPLPHDKSLLIMLRLLGFHTKQKQGDQLLMECTLPMAEQTTSWLTTMIE